ncbi:MAG: Gfo/Idh/MocA family oxidoreductase, partial [Planctomycetales bacterium]
MHVAVIGSGRWSRVHLAALSACGSTSNVTLVGRNEAAVQRLMSEFKVVGKGTTDLAAALNDPSVDVADIVLPHHLHYQVSLLALQAGKNVICEKPASLSLDQFDELLVQAQQNDLRFLVVMNQLYHPLNQRVQEMVDSGAVGRPFLLVENDYSNHASHYRDPSSWRTRLETAGGGVLIDGGYHMIYKQLAWLASQGYPSWVSAEAAQLAIEPGGAAVPELGEDFVSYNCGYASSLRINS